jgi:hypothetical protein
MITNSLNTSPTLELQRQRVEQRPQESPRDSKTDRPSSKEALSKADESEKVPQTDTSEKTERSQETQQEQSFASLIQSVMASVTPSEVPKDTTAPPVTESLEKKTSDLQLEAQALVSAKVSPKEDSHSQSQPNLKDDSNSDNQASDITALSIPADSSTDNPLIFSPETSPTQQGSKTSTSNVSQVVPTTASEVDLTATEQARQNWAPLLIKRAASSVEATIDTPVGQVQVTGKIIGGEATVVVSAPIALRPQLSQDGQMSEFQDGTYRWDWQQERETPRRDNTEEE